MTSQSKGGRAKELADKQRRYDLLHHRMRVQYYQGAPDHLSRSIVRNSERILANPDACLTRAVDLNDTQYLAELDCFALTASRQVQG